MGLIDKSAIVAEIKNRIKKLQNLHKENEEKLDSIQKTAILLCIDECKVILSFLDTLEVKEDNLETLLQSLPEKIYDENSHQVYEMSVYHFDGQCVVDYVGEIEHDSLCSFGGDTFYEAAESAWEYLRKDSLGS